MVACTGPSTGWVAEEYSGGGGAPGAGRVAEEFSGGGDAPAAALRRAGRGAWGGHIRAGGCFTTTKLHPSRTDCTRSVDSPSLASSNPYIFCQFNDPFWRNHDFLVDKVFMKSVINDPRSIFDHLISSCKSNFLLVATFLVDFMSEA